MARAKRRLKCNINVNAKTKSHQCRLCEERASFWNDMFFLDEDIEDWDSDKKTLKLIKKGSAICAKCLTDYIEDTERVPKTTPQIVYKYVGIESDC